MKIHQLSLFLENKPGQMVQPLRLLADAGIGIHTLTLADTQQFGLLRLIVDPPWTFIRTYFFQRGFLDGLEGLIIAYMAAFYTFLKYSKARNMS